MPCYHPRPVWRARRVNEKSGKRAIAFRLKEGFVDRPMTVPCGVCIGCKLEYSRQWAMRCMHEASLWQNNCFVTLTYEDSQIPPGGSLRPKDFQDFMKRLRWKYGEGIRFFQCGEYGSTTFRPHHHALLFNHEFTDLTLYKTSGNPLYVSRDLESLWGHGMCTVGGATFETAAYVARYTLKKVVGPAAEAHYRGRVPEYLTMSRRPGIGRGFVDKYRVQIYRRDSVVVRGKEVKPARYYDLVEAQMAPSVMERVKGKRRAAAQRDENNSGARLLVRESVKLSGIRSLRRDL